ncbi:alpha-glucosidase [Lactobacillus sp. Sy-1]|uniref:glycoside hydrolase family 13 protein n=1 Tax=Lactobacillus sp. Sy-1 TaxID=2109645 RepID=UPI001C5BBEB0|nr:alpha-glucosidase [Lactobacillus sp. Sy-1]MBW1606228.1 alpha-glucosidase [Lactobacillus sp. Sy-1]
MKKPWFADAVVYQIYPMSFQDSNHDGIGDLNGIKQRLDYVDQLGANFIWLNPIYKSPNADNGYDISDYCAIQPAYGTLADFDSLLAAANRLNIGIMMDLVVNHTSEQHPWFLASKKNRNNPYADYYIWRDPVDGHAPNDWLGVFQGSAWTYVPERDQYYLHSFASAQPDLNWQNPAVRAEVRSIMKFWLDRGVRGFRMDAIDFPAKPKWSNEGQTFTNVGDAMPDLKRLNRYLQEINQQVLANYDRILTVGEMSTADPATAAEFSNLDGSELNMVFEFEHVDLAANKDKRIGKWSSDSVSVKDLKRVLSKWQVGLDGKGWNSLYWNNHDQPRAVSRFATDDPKWRVKAAKMLGTTLHLLQGTPYVYEGEEIGMTNAHLKTLQQYEDLDSLNAYHELVDEKHLVSGPQMLEYLAARSRDNARTPMQWNSESNAGFTDAQPWYALNPNYDQINVAESLSDPTSVFHYYQQLIQLRHANEVVKYGNYLELDPDDGECFAYVRQLESRRLLVISNFTENQIERDYGQNQGTRLIGNYDDDLGVSIRPYECKVYELNN